MVKLTEQQRGVLNRLKWDSSYTSNMCSSRTLDSLFRKRLIELDEKGYIRITGDGRIALMSPKTEGWE